jgi:predicted RNA-binding Zn-ribbon protein involved in translation (DUF1610 family)
MIAKCETCGTPAEVDETTRPFPTPPKGWQVLHSLKGLEYECPKCWAEKIMSGEQLVPSVEAPKKKSKAA